MDSFDLLLLKQAAIVLKALADGFEDVKTKESTMRHVYCDQEASTVLQEYDGVSEATRSVSAWQLVCWLGEYMQKNQD